MTITDNWLNPMGAGTTALGYRENLEDFYHDIYSFFLSSIREIDISNVRLVWRWLQGMQREFESTYGKIISLPDLYSPDRCNAAYLDYLKEMVGVTDELNYLWGVLDENEKRRLIKYFVRFLIYRSTPSGILEVLQNMTGRNVDIVDYFDMRWILSGEDKYSMECALGREDRGFDCNLLSELDIEMSGIPNSVSLVTIGGFQQYEFDVTNIVETSQFLDNANEDNDSDFLARIPKTIRLIYRPMSASIVVALTKVANTYIARAPAEYYFAQKDVALSTDINDFRAGWDSDQYVFDILIDDPDGNLDHLVVEALTKFFRPLSERIYIRYYSYLEKFDEVNNWLLAEGTTVYDETNKQIIVGGVNFSRYKLVVSGSDTWASYAITTRALINEYEKDFDTRFYYTDENNYFYFRVTSHEPPSIPVGSWELGKVVAGVPTVIDSGDLEQFDEDVDYTWRIVVSDGRIHPELGNKCTIEIFHDENLIYQDSLVTAGLPTGGTIMYVTEAGTEVFISRMTVNPVPMESTYVGL